MGLTAKQENELTLANLLGINSEQAEKLLDVEVLLNIDAKSELAINIGNEIEKILSRTISNVKREVRKPAVEILIGNVKPMTDGKLLHVNFVNGEFHICSNSLGFEGGSVHSILATIVSCYASASALRNALNQNDIQGDDEIILNFTKIFPYDLSQLDSEVNIGKVFLAGGGAVGNAFLYGLSFLKVTGELTISDFDTVSDGNLNRCIWFDAGDISKNKAKVLKERAQKLLPKLTITDLPYALDKTEEKNGNPKWLSRLVVAVDSKRARRSLQAEVPGEVFDASTTGVEEIVLHFHKRPLSGNACLSCVYCLEPDELSHEKHIAESLGVGVDETQSGSVSEEASKKIIAKHSNLQGRNLIGLSYDTLFKELCGQHKSELANGEQVLAPFSFVSILAGTILALETFFRIKNNEHKYNYWRLSPWRNPLPELKRNNPKNPKCDFCGDEIKSRVADDIWIE